LIGWIVDFCAYGLANVVAACYMVIYI